MIPSALCCIRDKTFDRQKFFFNINLYDSVKSFMENLH